MSQSLYRRQLIPGTLVFVWKMSESPTTTSTTNLSGNNSSRHQNRHHQVLRARLVETNDQKSSNDNPNDNNNNDNDVSDYDYVDDFEDICVNNTGGSSSRKLGERNASKQLHDVNDSHALGAGTATGTRAGAGASDYKHLPLLPAASGTATDSSVARSDALPVVRDHADGDADTDADADADVDADADADADADVDANNRRNDGDFVFVEHDSPYLAKFACVLCKTTLNPPVKQTPCGHRLCHSCVQIALLEDRNVDGSAITTSSRTSFACPAAQTNCVTSISPQQVMSILHTYHLHYDRGRLVGWLGVYVLIVDC